MLPSQLVQEKTRKIDFQNGRHGGLLRFPIRKILAILIYKSLRYYLPSFMSIGLLVQEKKRKIDFQDGRHCSHLGFPIRMILAIFDLQVFDASYQVTSQLVIRFRRRSEK